MILVIDASVAVKWFVQEDLSPEAWSLLEAKHRLIAPELIVAELANVVWKKTIRQEIDFTQAQSIIRSIVLPSFISEFIETTTLSEQAFALAVQWNHPVYDCFYAACAEALSAPLVSADEKFLRLLNVHNSPIRGTSLTRLHELIAG